MQIAVVPHLEFGLKNGLSSQSSLNSGQQVDLLLARIAAAYYRLDSFDQLPTPFRCVALDLVTAKRVVLDRGRLTTVDEKRLRQDAAAATERLFAANTSTAAPWTTCRPTSPATWARPRSSR